MLRNGCENGEMIAVEHLPKTGGGTAADEDLPRAGGRKKTQLTFTHLMIKNFHSQN